MESKKSLPLLQLNSITSKLNQKDEESFFEMLTQIKSSRNRIRIKKKKNKKNL